MYKYPSFCCITEFLSCTDMITTISKIKTPRIFSKNSFKSRKIILCIWLNSFTIVWLYFCSSRLYHLLWSKSSKPRSFNSNFSIPKNKTFLTLCIIELQLCLYSYAYLSYWFGLVFKVLLLTKSHPKFNDRQTCKCKHLQKHWF